MSLTIVASLVAMVFSHAHYKGMTVGTILPYKADTKEERIRDWLDLRLHKLRADYTHGHP